MLPGFRVLCCRDASVTPDCCGWFSVHGDACGRDAHSMRGGIRCRRGHQLSSWTSNFYDGQALHMALVGHCHTKGGLVLGRGWTITSVDSTTTLDLFPSLAKGW